MTSVLALDGVTKRYCDGRRTRTALHEVSLAVEAGELVAVWGARGSGRTTLLRVAAGMERPDAGSVRVAGADLAADLDVALGDGIGFVQPRLLGPQKQRLADRLAIVLAMRGWSRSEARSRVREALHRFGVAHCEDLQVGQLDETESVRVGMAHALLLEPRLLLVDEPTAAVPLIERDGVLALLRDVAASGVAVLMTAGDAIGLSGVDRAITISDGRLRSNVVAPTASVVALRAVTGG